MNPMLNRPFDQPKQHTATYRQLSNRKETSEPQNGTPDETKVTFYKPQGMSTPWQQWEEAIHILMDRFELQQFPTNEISDFAVIDNWIVIEPNQEGGNDFEYEIETATKFKLWTHQGDQSKHPSIVGTLFSFQATYVEDELHIHPSAEPLATVQVRMEFNDKAETNAALQEILDDPDSRKSIRATTDATSRKLRPHESDVIKLAASH